MGLRKRRKSLLFSFTMSTTLKKLTFFKKEKTIVNIPKMCQVLLHFLESTTRYICCVLFILGGLMSCIGNTLVLFIINKPVHRAKKSHIFYASLAVSDMLIGCLVFPLHVVQSIAPDRVNICHIEDARRSFLTILIFTSSLAVSTIAYDRYTMMTKLNNYNQFMTKRKVYILIAITWLTPCILVSLKYVNANVYVLAVFIGTILPPFVLLFCYYVIIRVMKRSRRDVNAHVEGNEQPSSIGYIETMQSKNHEQRVTRKVTILILMYIACYLPGTTWFCITMFTLIFRVPVMSVQVSLYWYPFSTFIVLLNSCINPLVYIAKDPILKRTFLEMFRSINKRGGRRIEVKSIPTAQ